MTKTKKRGRPALPYRTQLIRLNVPAPIAEEVKAYIKWRRLEFQKNHGNVTR